MEAGEIITKIEQNLSTIDSSKADVEVGFFGGSFTCLEIEEQKKYLELVQPYIQSSKVKSIRISTRPDYINRKEKNDSHPNSNTRRHQRRCDE